MVLSLLLTPKHLSIQVDLSWDVAPIGVIEYLVFYRKTAYKRVKSVSTTDLSLTISNLIDGQLYSIQAVAYRGGYAKGYRFSETEVATMMSGSVPEAVGNLTAVVSVSNAVIAGQISLSWNASVVDVNYPVLHYVVSKSTDNVNFTTIATLEPNVLSHNIENLTNGQLYYLRVTAHNLIGNSDYSDAQATPLDLASPPSDIIVAFDPDASVALADGYQSVKITWQNPTYNGGLTVTSYRIIYSLDANFVNNVFSLDSAPDGTENIQDQNLIIPQADRVTSTGWYFFKVGSVTALGLGSYSNIFTIDAVGLPNAVADLVASNMDGANVLNGSEILTWSYAVDDRCPLLGYILSYVDENDILETLFVADQTLAPSFQLDNLQNGFEYDVTVTAINVRGSGSDTNIAFTPSYLCNAPELEVTGHGDKEINLAWNAPNAQGSAIVSYNLYRSIDNATYDLIVNQVGLTYNDEDPALENGTTYFYKVSAVNANGEGSLSDSASEYPSKAPNSPSALSVVNSNSASAGNQLTSSFTCNINNVATNGGSVVTGFKLYKDSVLLVSLASNVLNYVDSAVLNAIVYAYQISAVNRDGEGALSNAVSNNSSGLPDAPTGLSVTRGDSQLTIQFDDLEDCPSNSANDEGNSIIGYRVYRDGQLLTIIGNIRLGERQNSYSYVNSGLINGQQHSYQVSATNDNGEGAKCTAINGTPSTVPDAPSGLTAVHGDGSVQLSFNALNVASNGNNSHPCDEGSAVTTYHICKSLDNVTFTMVQSANSNTINVNNLVNGTLYYFKVSASNANGEGAKSASVSCRPSRSPNTVRNVNIQSFDSELVVSWDAPLNDESGAPSGGLAFTYNLVLLDSNENEVSNQSGLTDLQVTINGLNDHETYQLQLYANNGVDTLFNVYYANAVVVPRPAKINNLVWNNADPNQISISFSYMADLYSVLDYNLVFIDVTLNDAGNMTVLKNSNDSLVNGLYHYTVLIDSTTSSMLAMQTSDVLRVVIQARNSYGLSQLSNHITVN